MRTDSSIERFDTHNVAYCPTEQQFKNWPVAIVKHNEKKWLCVSLHKWDAKHIAFLKVCDAEDVSATDAAACVVNSMKAIYKEYGHRLIESIEAGELDCDGINLLYYKWSVNVWREVCKKKTKWVFVGEKPSKEDPCQIERVLKNSAPLNTS